MTTYISAAVPQDRAQIKADIIADMQAAVPGLVVLPATKLDFIIDVFASRYAQLYERVSEVTTAIFRWYGTNILRRPPLDATQAAGDITVVAADTLGHTLPAGTELTLLGLDGNRVGFVLVDDLVIGVGDDTGTGQIVAIEAGAAGTGLESDPQLEETGDTVAWVDTITVDDPTVGGEDGETDEAYVDRIADQLLLLAETLVTARDFEIGARNQPGVAYALAVDEYNTVGPDDTAPGHITDVLRNDDGDPVGAPVSAAVLAYLEENSVAQLQPHVTDPTYTTIDVIYVGVAEIGYVAADVETRADAAILSFLDRAVWGINDRGEWVEKDTVYFQDLVTVLNNVKGFDHYTTLTINGGTADVVMDGPGALPASDSSVDGTVT